MIDQQTAVSYIKGQELYNPKACFIRPVINKSVCKCDIFPKILLH